jgi:hypothetical protein
MQLVYLNTYKVLVLLTLNLAAWANLITIVLIVLV